MSAVRLAESHGACDILGLEAFNEDHLYSNLAWLSEQQEVIEKRLFWLHYGEATPQLFLYDVTSSYLEGIESELGAFVRKEESTRGHVFVVMLAYLLEREMDKYWRHLEVMVFELKLRARHAQDNTAINLENAF